MLSKIQGSSLSARETVDQEKQGSKTVLEVLKEKHPEAQQISERGADRSGLRYLSIQSFLRGSMEKQSEELLYTQKALLVHQELTQLV